jgi:hypothetical protein
MNPALHYELAQARIADLHQQGRHDALARAARAARRVPKTAAPGVTAVTPRRARTVFGVLRLRAAQ